MTIPNWDRLTRDQKVRALAFGPEVQRTCPTCGRSVAVVRGYVTQHSDPRSYGERYIRQCPNELTAVGSVSLTETVVMATIWTCAECDFQGTERDANPARDWCGYCCDDFPSTADLCPGCGHDSLCSACPRCAASYFEDTAEPEDGRAALEQG